MQKVHIYFVYIMSNKSRRLYTGGCHDLLHRTFEHKHKLKAGFISRYIFDMLVYYEEFSDIRTAIGREKQIKGWSRAKKLALILARNPDWADLSEGWYPYDEPPSPGPRVLKISRNEGALR
jgi:putative endonuclease